MKISAGMIVFQAESTLPPCMLSLCVKSLLPWVDEFIIVEGATAARLNEHRWDGDSAFCADKLGHSTDGTRQALRALQENFPKKVKLISRDGFWNGKTEMCNAYAAVATGDYLWHIDSDEFYHERDLPVIRCAIERGKPDAVHFYAHHFYGNFKNVVDDPAGQWPQEEPWRRIFKNGPGFKWASHEPPNYLDASGKPLNEGNVLTRENMRDCGVFLYHYSQVKRPQAEFKAKFFKRPEYLTMFNAWQNDPRTPLINGVRTIPFTEDHPHLIKDNYL